MKSHAGWVICSLVLALFLIMGACSSDSDSNSKSTPTPEKAFISDYTQGPWTTKEFVNDSQDFQFAIVSDRCGIHRPGVFSEAINDLNLLQPEFVINIGDLIEGYTEDAIELSQMREEIDGVLNQLEMPFFRVVGNHDMGNDFMRQDWLSRYGRDYYHFVYKDALFLCISTEDPPTPLPPDTIDKMKWFMSFMAENPEAATKLALDYYGGKTEESPEDIKAAVEAANISDAQAEYFRKAIEDNPNVRWIYIFLHKPAWREDYNCPNFGKIVEALGERPYTVFAGHEHYYQYAQVNGRDHIVLGATGGLVKGVGSGYMDHVVWVTMTDDEPEICNLTLSGMLNREISEPVSSSAP